MNQEEKQKRYNLLIQQLTIISLYWSEENPKKREFYINMILDEIIELRKKLKNGK